MNIDVETPFELEPRTFTLLQRVRGRSLADVDFVVYFRKHRDYVSLGGRDWDGEPIRTGRIMVKIDHPDDWKHTWFLFLRPSPAAAGVSAPHPDSVRLDWLADKMRRAEAVKLNVFAKFIGGENTWIRRVTVEDADVQEVLGESEQHEMDGREPFAIMLREAIDSAAQEGK